MTRTLKLALRLDRLELAIFVLCVLGLLGCTTYVVAAVAGLLPSLADCSDQTSPCPAYGLLNDQIAIGHLVMLGFLVVAILAGALLGSQLVSREIERGTAPTVWSLARSRLRWFAPRAAVALALLLVLVIPLAVAGQFLEGAIEPTVDPSASMIDLPTRGLGLLSVAIGTFAAGLFLGAVFGRMLPALLVTAFAGGVVIAAVALLPALVGQPKVIGSFPSAAIAHSIVFEQRFRTPNGELLNLDEAMAMAPAGTNPEDWAWQNFDRVAYGISGSDYPTIALTTAAIIALVSVGLVGCAALVVRRRRPE